MRFTRTYIYSVLLLLSCLISNVVSQRGKGRSRGRPPAGGPMMTTFNQDTNSKMEYYNNPLGAKIVKASHFDLEYVLGDKVTFLCEAQGDPRPHIIWFKDGLELYAHPYLQGNRNEEVSLNLAVNSLFVKLHEWKIGVNVTKSKMEIDPATQMDAGLYECHAHNKYSIDRRTFKADFTIED